MSEVKRVKPEDLHEATLGCAATACVDVVLADTYSDLQKKMLEVQHQLITRNHDLFMLRDAAKKLTDFYSHIWDRADGCITLFPTSVPAFEKAHADLCSALADGGDGS